MSGGGGGQGKMVEASGDIPGARQGAWISWQGEAAEKAARQGRPSIAVDAMIRRPRYPLTLRLAWMEQELSHAARLLPAMIGDARALRQMAEATDAKVVLVAHLAVTVLLPFGADPRKVEAFIVELGPEGDIEQADVLAGELLAEVLMGAVETRGEGN